MDQFLLFAATDATLTLDIKLKLWSMNFLEFAVWGAWFVVLGQYLNALNFDRKQIGRIYATMALGAIVAPIFGGSIADRYFNSENVMAVLHLIGAGLLFWMAQISTPRKFYWVALAYALVYSPTLALNNAIVFANVPDANTGFPIFRVLGTVGWIAANLFLKVLLKPGQPVNNRPLLLAAALSAVLGVLSFYLPETAPKSSDAIPFLKAMELLVDPAFAVFFGISFLITIALAFYYSFASLYLEQGVGIRSDVVGPLMTIGQWMEIIFLLLLSRFLGWFGMKWVLVIGMTAWALRYGLFSLGRPYLVVLIGIALHGICFDFFFAAGFIYVENTSPAEITNSAQSLFTVLTYGLGIYLGTEAAGWLNQFFSHEVTDPTTGETVKVTNWSMFWLVPCVGATLCLIPFIILFR